jgi:hypothetical protein
MRAGMSCLLDVLGGQGITGGTSEAEFEAAIALADEEHILPWSANCLRLRKCAIPLAISNRVDQIERDAARAAFYWSSELKGILRSFDRSNIRVVPLKGPLLAERLYGNAALRVSRDLDLLVHEADLPRAKAVLAAVGFAPGVPDDYHRPWYRQTTTVELHHDVENPLAFDFCVESALQRAHPAIFQGERCWQLAPEDELLFLCLHAVRHRFERLSLILDLQLAFRELPAVVSDSRRRQEVAGLDNLLTLGLAMVRRLQRVNTVDLDVAGTKMRDQHLEKLADRLWQRLLTQPSERLDWRNLHAFYLEIELPGWPRFCRRCRHLRILASRVIEPDYAFAARFGLHRAWQARTLRPVRWISDLVRRHASS